MTDHPSYIVVPLRVRYATWPGGESTVLEAMTDDGLRMVWLLAPDGRSSELRPFRYGMFREARWPT